jgi:putative Mg2+ transporter-C (MgtC) family protein
MNGLDPFSWSAIIHSDLGRLIIVTLLSLPTAYDREHSTRLVGLRTYPLVAVATCGFVLISHSFISPENDDAQSRIVQGILTGIGFIGGGAILKKEDQVIGTASAASIWVTAAIGVAVAYGEFGTAVALSLINFLILWGFSNLKRMPVFKNEDE